VTLSEDERVTPDNAFVRRVADADAEALRVLYERHGRLVYSFARRITTDPGLAEECTQDVFLTLWRKAAGFDPERAKLTTWLLSITRNRAIELVRQRQRRPETRPEIEPPGTSPDTADLVAAADEAELVAEAIGSLPEDQLEVVRLSYFDGLSHSEIAEVIGIPLGTVKGRMRLALGRLRPLVATLEASGTE
jgi:RNA polymerase sigma-70 factor, ECF subfamily